MRWRRDRAAAVGVAVVVAALAAGCSDGSGSSDRPVVEVFGPVVGTSADRLGTVLREAGDRAGVDVRYVGVSSYVEQLRDRLDQGDRPGIALVPQPGVLREMVDRGVVAPVELEGDQAVPTGLLELASVGGEPMAVWLTVDVKGLVWFRPDRFAAEGWTRPATLDELGALAEEIRASGTSPWCLYMEAGGSTGWVGSDWVEDYVLRRLGPEAYDRWTSGALPFDDPAVVSVFDELDEVLRRPGSIAGGSRAALTTPWEEAGNELVASSRCVLLAQADFVRDEFPDGTTIGPDGDVDFFPVPPADAGEPAPMLVGGLLATALVDDPAVAAMMAELAGAEVAAALVATGDFLSPHLEIPDTAVPDETGRRLVRILREAEVLRFDGSDVMPAAVGTGTFWEGMRAFVAGERIDTVVATIQDGWTDVEGSL